MRRIGRPASRKACRIGFLKRLHQVSYLKSEAHSRREMAALITRLRAPFFTAYWGFGLLIHRLASSQRTPSLAKMARTVSPVTRLSVSTRSELSSVTISDVHRLISVPNSLEERWSNSYRASAPYSSKAARVRLGLEEPASRAPRTTSLKSLMALCTVSELRSNE